MGYENGMFSFWLYILFVDLINAWEKFYGINTRNGGLTYDNFVPRDFFF